MNNEDLELIENLEERVQALEDRVYYLEEMLSYFVVRNPELIKEDNNE